MKPRHLVAALLIGAAPPSFASEGQADRLQVGLYEKDVTLASQSGEPLLTSVEWSLGDLRVRLTQAAPCGHLIPVNPVWETAGTSVVLRYDWLAMEPIDREKLCLKHVQAWLFRVPNLSYTVSISDAVQREFAVQGTK
ncbi:MAG TPA: hypothetical protein VIN03_24530 [Roseateles sp.]